MRYRGELRLLSYFLIFKKEKELESIKWNVIRRNKNFFEVSIANPSQY